MARCSACQQPCRCSVADDGALIFEVGSGVLSFDLIPGGQTGRRSTVVQGRGTALDPYTVSFIDSSSYQAIGFEYQAFDIPGFPSVGNYDVSALRYTVYPYQMRLDIPIPIGSVQGFGVLNISNVNNLVAGFYASLSTGGVSRSIVTELFFDPLVADDGPLVVCADNSVRSNPAHNAMGFISPLRGIDFGSSGLIGNLIMNIIAPDGVDPTILDHRIWAALI